ncbi:MAG TPA: MFS transporter, partial [Nitrososphaerales archaeon]|nr:MFS transporter [Nitrososphaerales archaeon]
RARGYFLGTFARVIYFGALVALLLTTALTAYYPSPAALYLLAGGFFVFSALILVGQKDQMVEKKPISTDGSASLRKYYVATGVYGLFWGFAWPLFTITTVNIVHANLFQYSLAQVIAVASTIGFQPVIGRFVDRSRRRGVFWGRMGLVVYPVIYMFMSAPWQLYVLNIFSGVTNAFLNVAFVAYLYDIAPAGQRGRYNAEYNLVTGVTTMIGSVSAGFALVYLTVWNSLWLSLAYLYVISAVGRAAGAILHLKLPYGPKRQAPQGTVLR